MIKFRAKILSLLLQLFTLVIFPVAASAQSNIEMKKIFAQAESYYLYEEYDLANQLYILLETPDNFNIQFKIGTCYLNIPGEKEKAIPYLEAAVKNSSYSAKIASFKEKRAPLDAYFFLAKAYMINNELDKAVNTLQTFKKLAIETEEKGGMKNLAYIDQEILACKNAIKYQEAPVNLSKSTLG
jgi:tetratricopeptide (TPR) repeat protein